MPARLSQPQPSLQHDLSITSVGSVDLNLSNTSNLRIPLRKVVQNEPVLQHDHESSSSSSTESEDDDVQEQGSHVKRLVLLETVLWNTDVYILSVMVVKSVDDLYKFILITGHFGDI